MTIEQKRRKLFEASMRVALLNDEYQEDTIPEVMARGSNGQYSSIRVKGAWEGFNAALDAVEIELPYAAWSCDMGEKVMSADCVYAAIESTGLGLKVKS